MQKEFTIFSPMVLPPPQICLFKYVGDKDKDGIEDSDVHQEEAWEQMPMVAAGGERCDKLEWGPNPRVMSVATEQSIVVLRRTLLAARLRDTVAAVQLSQTEVREPHAHHHSRWCAVLCDYCNLLCIYLIFLYYLFKISRSESGRERIVSFPGDLILDS
jgi:hypothetical protein